MSTTTIPGFYAGRATVPTPYAGQGRVIEFMRHYGVRYLIVDQAHGTRFRPQLRPLAYHNKWNELRAVYRHREDGRRLVVYELVPATVAARRPRPPAGAGGRLVLIRPSSGHGSPRGPVGSVGHVMGRWIRWTVLALVVVVVTGTVILVITVRPGLQDDAQEVRRTWKPLLQPLATRYLALKGVESSARARPATVTAPLTRQLQPHAERLGPAPVHERRRRPRPATADELEGLAVAGPRDRRQLGPRLKPNADAEQRHRHRSTPRRCPRCSSSATTTRCSATSGTATGCCAASSRTSTATSRTRRSSCRRP